jgi:mannose-1-phosphate guanylyltransferase
MLINYEEIGMIAVVRAASRKLSSSDLGSLTKMQDQMIKRGRLAMLIDLGGVRAINRSGLAALVEFASGFPLGARLGFFGAQDAVGKELAACPLTAGLPIFKDLPSALNAQDFRDQQLAGMKAVLLCAGAGSRMAPMTNSTPKPMLDVFGTPILEHLMNHLHGFGIRDMLLNPGHHAPHIHKRFSTTARRSMFFLNEGQYMNGAWQARPLGSASTLARLAHQHSAFTDDFLVMCGDALTDLDLASLVKQHKDTDADITIAAARVPLQEVSKYGVIDADDAGRVRQFQEKPTPNEACSTLVSTGIYVINPRALTHVSEGAGQDIANDLLPTLLAQGGRIFTYAPEFSWVDFGCGRDYFDALEQGLTAGLPGLVPGGHEKRPGLWVEESAQVHPRAQISGPCYVGPGAVIEKDAKIDGPCVISANATIKGRTLVRRSVVCDGTTLHEGSWADNMIVHSDWAINHRFADGRPQNCAPLEVHEQWSEQLAPPSRWYSKLTGALT